MAAQSKKKEERAYIYIYIYYSISHFLHNIIFSRVPGTGCLVQVELETPREKVKLPELASEILAWLLFHAFCFFVLFMFLPVKFMKSAFIKVTAEPSALRVATGAMPTFRMRRRPTSIWTNLLFDYSLLLLLATLGRLHLQPISMLKGLLERVVAIFQLHYLFITESAHAHSTEFNI